MAENIRTQNGMVELTETLPDGPLCNRDIYPTKIEERHWSKWNIAALWIGMAICIPTYMLAAGLLGQGMNWWQAIVTILIGNVVVLLPMLLNAHPGTKYGISFPVLSRAAFGTRGAHIPALLRGLVACGWFGVQTWIGGLAIYECIRIIFPGFADMGMLPTGISVGQAISFMIFWAINVAIIYKGIESIRWMEDWGAPLLIIVGLALMGWAFAQGTQKVFDASYEFAKPAVSVEAGLEKDRVLARFNALQDEGKPRAEKIIFSQKPLESKEQKLLVGKTFDYQNQLALELEPGTDLNRPVKLYFQFTTEVTKEDKVTKETRYSSVVAVDYNPQNKQTAGSTNFWAIFFPLLTAMVGFWATLSLNIPDFTRYARSQKEQMQGQVIGLPVTMAFYSFVGLIATSAGILIFKDILIASDAPWDPVALMGRLDNKVLVFGAMFALMIATLTTNLAANVVAPANGFANLWPEKISFRTGGLITGIIGILMFPWKLIESTQGYIFTWLIGYSALLGPIAGIVIADYYIIRRTQLSLYDLYQENGAYRYSNGINPVAIIALVIGVLPNIPGFLIAAGFVSASAFPGIFYSIYTYAWFVGFVISLIIYSVGMKVSNRGV